MLASLANMLEPIPNLLGHPVDGKGKPGVLSRKIRGDSTRIATDVASGSHKFCPTNEIASAISWSSIKGATHH